MRTVAPLACILVLGCAGTEASSDDGDLATHADASHADASHADLAPPRDLVVGPLPDLALGPDLACTLGDPDHCGSCQTVW